MNRPRNACEQTTAGRSARPDCCVHTKLDEKDLRRGPRPHDCPAVARSEQDGCVFLEYETCLTDPTERHRSTPDLSSPRTHLLWIATSSPHLEPHEGIRGGGVAQCRFGAAPSESGGPDTVPARLKSVRCCGVLDSVGDRPDRPNQKKLRASGSGRRRNRCRDEPFRALPSKPFETLGSLCAARVSWVARPHPESPYTRQPEQSKNCVVTAPRTAASLLGLRIKSPARGRASRLNCCQSSRP